MDEEAPVLVVGATGRQGGATARELLAAGVPVRALVRDPASDRAKAVEAAGAELVAGDLLEKNGLARAVKGARAVFSVQMPDMSGPEPDFAGEVTQAVNLIEAAKDAGVPQFVHTSVSGAGSPELAEERWAFLAPSMEAKAAIQDRLRAAEFPRWTLLKPGFFMENFLPATQYVFPRGIEGGLVTILRPETRLSLAATRDIGRAAAAAIAEPERFHRVELELASDYRSMAEIAPILSRVLGVPLPVPDMTVEEALAAGMPPMGFSHKMLNELGQPARPEFARELGIPLTSFEEWAETAMRA
ncbi:MULTISPECIES: NmrA/HSCARG family protein [Amycolatopsis]|uniref:NmrA/HSCARG family protein n=1 Tax=Amycolatopsis dendrobii TaxID=2760662 RepID=A0A7W3ZDP1_9PSEU|nr:MULTISPECIES: NmrA/HSCARG family protein [Amycolatopsis]MBB1157153.1 NmrA/HSCARG family protein [Amycolatopsis dendrobii]UKD59454.1 NmrA/HSCARG family protein [Amycolatopsis sp. FU40]